MIRLFCRGLCLFLFMFSMTAAAKSAVKNPKRKAAPKVQIKEIKVGEGLAVESGAKLRLRYQQWLHDPKSKNGRGELIDSNLEKAELVIRVDDPGLLHGLSQGLMGLRVGGKRELRVPAAMAYGAAGAGGNLIPPNRDLIYEVELVGME